MFTSGIKVHVPEFRIEHREHLFICSNNKYLLSRNIYRNDANLKDISENEIDALIKGLIFIENSWPHFRHTPEQVITGLRRALAVWPHVIEYHHEILFERNDYLWGDTPTPITCATSHKNITIHDTAIVASTTIAQMLLQ
jgi:hypothetical protein